MIPFPLCCKVVKILFCCLFLLFVVSLGGQCVLEWTRAVTITATLVTMLLMFAFKQKLTHYGPTWSYLCITGLYYILTEKTFVQFFPDLVDLIGFRSFGGFDELWEQAILKAATATVAAVVSIVGFKFGENCL